MLKGWVLLKYGTIILSPLIRFVRSFLFKREWPARNVVLRRKGSVHNSWDWAYHPEENVRCGIRYLGDLYKSYASWEKVLRHDHSGDPNSKREVTHRYVEKVLKQSDMTSETGDGFIERNDDHQNKIVDICFLRSTIYVYWTGNSLMGPGNPVRNKTLREGHGDPNPKKAVI